MSKQYFNEYKKKKEEEEKKTGSKTPSQSSSSQKAASKSTFLGGGSAVTNVKKASEKKGPSEAKKKQAASNALKTSQKSTFMGGTQTTPTRRTTTKTTTNRDLTANTTAAQRQKMGMPTSEDLRNARESRRNLATNIKNSVKEASSADNKAFMQRQKSGTLTTADKQRIEQTSQRRAEVARNTGAAARKGAEDSITGYRKTLADLAEMTQSTDRASYGQAAKLGIDKDEDIVEWAKLEGRRKKGYKQAKEQRLALQEKQDERQAEWDERTKNATGFEKALYGAAESGTGMLVDIGVGAATGTGQFGALASMGLRTYGTTRGQAEKEGATEKEDRLYSLMQAGKEVGTELMFTGAGLAKKAYGKVGLSLADRAANVLTKGLTGTKADIVGAGVRLLGGTAEENIEELAGWGADHLIKELTYGKNVRQRTAESLRANIPQITNKAEADKVAAYFNTSEFTDELTKEYKKSGMSDDEANALAEEMRDYYLAYYSGDQKKLEELEDDLSRKLSGQPGLSKKSWSFDELGETFAATTLLTLATGLPGAVKTSVKGNQAFNDPNSPLKLKFGDNAAKLVANAVKNVSDKELSVKAEAMEQRLESGKDLTGTQKWDLLQGYQQKLNETAKKARASQDVVNTARREQNLVATMRTDRNGNVEYAKETQREFNQAYADAELTVEAVRRYLESENSISDDEVRRADAVKKAVADLHVGGMTVGDAHEFAYGNNLARETLRAEEGIDLDQYIVRDSKGSVDYAATNEATENALYALNAENAIRAAQEETRVYIDDTRGRIDSDIMGRMGVNGQATWKTINKTVDPRNINEYLTTARAASYFYSAGRNTDMDMENAINQYSGGAFRSVDKTVLREAFAAGSRDRMIANTPGYGQTVSAGSNIAMKNTAPIITGQFIMDENIKESVPDTVQQAYIALAMSTNTNVHLVSDLTAKGKDGKPIINQATGLPVQLNGMSKGNDIYINVNSTAEQNLGYVFMHEMTHQIKQYAPNEYMGLENLVRERWFNKNNAQMQQAIQSRIDLYKTKGGQSLTEEEAMEEIIADAMAEAMDDPNFAAQVCEEDINLGQAILNSIKAALRSIRQIFASGDFQNENFHNGLLSYLGILDEAEKMWINALHQARINKANGLIADWQDNANKQNEARLSVNEEIDEKPISEKQREALNAEGIEELDDGTTARYSLTSWKETNKDKKLKALVAAGHSRDASESWIDDINSIASIIHGDPERLDYIADRANKFLKPNGDYYKYTLDASTLCDKRRIYQGTYDAIQHAMPNIPLMQDDVVRIRTLLKEMDHKAPCGICYVESQRKNLGDYAKQWYDSYARKDEIQLADVTTTNGLKALKESNPEVAADFEKAMAAKGVSSPKVVKLRTDYREDIMRMRPQTVEYLNSIGGLRFHSFSDFETPHLIDTMQAVMDMATKNLKGMAYAKVPNFAAVFGPTGIKINLSLIAKTDENGNAVHDEDGRLVFDSVEGIPYEEAKVWRDAYPDDVAFILVGKDKKHTLEAINDDRVDFVIPFHRSKWSAEDMRRLGLVGYEDFATGHQENGIFVSEFWNYDISGRENAENYLKLCAEKGVTPVFEQLLKQNEDGTYSLQDDGSTDNYWKLLVEGKMYNHKTKKGAPQKLVKPNFNMEEARRILNEYEGGANELPVADDVVKAFVKEYKQNHPDAEIADAKYSIAATLDDAYMNAVNSGNMEEAQRLVDEAAKAAMPDTKLKGHWYHGTENDFTVFNFSQGGKNGTADGFGIYLTNDPEVASSYGNRMIEGYVNATRPASALTSQTLTKAELRRLITRTVEDEAIQMAEDYDSNVEEAKFDTWISNYTDTRYAGTINKAIDQVISGITSYNGNDMDIIQEIMVGMGIRNYDEATKFYDILTETTGIDGFVTKWGDESEMADPNTPTIALAFRSSQIKSADTVTYAEDGSVIPLSERFDLSNNDIRYSLPTTDSDGRALSDGQMEYFKNSQARDSQGRLQTVYHTTNYGGFTIFDPSYSDDRRSLFFASNFDVSQTYGSGAINPVDLNNEPFKTWDDFVKAANEEFKNYPEWDPNKSFYENTEFSFTNGIRKADIPFEEWIKLSHKEQRDSDYGVEMALPVKGNPDFDWTWYEFYDFDTMLKELNWAMGRGKKQRGFYQVYLNLENPLVVDAKGANWNKIPYGEKGENAERIRTLQRMKEDSAFVIDRVSMEWVYDDDGDIISMDEPSSLHLRIEGSKVTVDSDLVPYTVDEMFYMSSEDIDNWDPNDNSTMVILYEKLDEYWTYDIGLSGEYLEWIAEYADKNGDVNYIPMNVNQEHAADYIDLDGYKLEYAEYFDDENPEGTLPYTNAKDPTFKTRELAKIAQDAGHDGVIIRNCRDMGGVSYFKGSNPISDIFIAFDSNQIKDLENENPTVNPDIRYSITDEDAAMEWLATQYELDDVPLEDQQAEEGRIRMAKSKKEFVNSINTNWNER